MMLEMTESVSIFLQSQLETLGYQLTDSDRDSIRRSGISEFIYTQMTRSKFRRTKLDSETEDDIRSKIAYHVSRNEPIPFTMPFGAYKNWRLWSYPEPDWAEVFNVNYMLRFVAPMATAYPPGVKLQYSYGDEVMDIVSNMPIEDTDRYIATFDRLLAFFQAHIPENVTLQTVRINDFYTREEHREELRKNYEYNLRNWTQKYSEEEREYKLRSARRNLMPDGIQDLTNLGEDEWEKRCLEAAMWCDAHDCMKKRRGFNKLSTNIQIVFVRGPYLALHLGSCDTSSFHFWVGTGVVELRKNRLLQRIFSQPKLDSAINSGRAAFVSVKSPFSEFSSNFMSVPLLDDCSRK